ncbi:MAG: aspartate ammonia-lyase [bacterium]
MPRIERDALGPLELPDAALYGVQTLRAVGNFPVSGRGARPGLVRAYATLKLAACRANVALGALDPVRGEAIARAAEEVRAGDHADQFPVDPYQAGAGTSLNMNLNEVIANRALGLLGRPRGDHAFLSPNDHVNLGQSSNDTFPTAVHLALLAGSAPLLDALDALAAALERKAREFAAVVKAGRTHLNDALPVTLGDEFRAWAVAVERAAARLRERRDGLRELAIGGTAVGTGAGAAPGFRDAVIARLTGLTGEELRPARDPFEALQSRALLAALSSSLKELALELVRAGNDLRLLASGPTAGLAEIRLPAVQPGSSIMPGKVNPSLAECLAMVCFRVVGNDTAVALAVQAGQLELNVMTPLIAECLLESVELLASFLPVFTARCVAGIEADAARCRAGLALNPALVTLLVPRIGHLAAAALYDEALARGAGVAELAVEKGILTAAEAGTLLHPPAADR